MKQKNVVISGYYGFGNAGDEAILSSILAAFKKEAPEFKLTILSINPSLTEEEHSVSSVHRYRPAGLLKTLWNCNLLISGGGGLLQDTTSIRSPLYYLGLVFLAKVLGKKVMYYAQGIGPLNTWSGRFLTSRISRMVDFITVRDEDSLYILKTLGVSGPEMKVTTDPVFALEPAAEEEVMEVFKKEKIPGEGGWLGVSVRNWKTDKDYLSIIAQVADCLYEKSGIKILFIPMHFPEDFHVSEKTRSMMKNPSYIISNKYHPGVIMAIAGKMDCLISMRLHAVIMPSVAGVPSIPVAYDPKVEKISRQLGLEFINLENLNFAKLYDLS